MKAGIKTFIFSLLLLGFISPCVAQQDGVDVPKNLDQVSRMLLGLSPEEAPTADAETLVEEDGEDIFEDELYVQPEEAYERIPSKDTLIFSLDVAREAIKTDRYAVAVSQLRELLDQMKLARQRALGAFFPITFGGYAQEKSSNTPGYFTQVVDDYGVILTRHYVANEGQKVDVNLVYADPSIRDYTDMINNPTLIDSLQDVNLIRVDNEYKGIQKFSEEDRVCELNIVISHDILVNVIAIGVESPKQLDPFLSGTDFSAIKAFLE